MFVNSLRTYLFWCSPLSTHTYVFMKKQASRYPYFPGLSKRENAVRGLSAIVSEDKDKMIQYDKIQHL